MITPQFVLAAFPELNQISDAQLQKSCVDTWVYAAQKAHHDEQSIQKVLFADAGLKDCSITLMEHTRYVTETARMLAAQFNAEYSPRVTADLDLVTAAALLHDVGKLYESPAADPDGEIAAQTAFVRHPYLGAVFAETCGCPWKVSYLIANHSFEGDDARSFPELFILRNADMMHFQYLFFGYERKHTFKNG